MGKTTILFQLLSQLEGSARSVFLFQTLCTPRELLSGLLRDLGVVNHGGDAIGMQEQLNRLLLAEARQGRRVVVVVDEAQNLEDSALELLRMLSNFETSSYKLMQIILAGQPQLREKLASSHLIQLRQRMSIFARIHPFSAEETQLYVGHRLRVAGYDSKTPLFTPMAGALIAKYSEGIPRNINNICFNALSLGCVLKQKTIGEEVVRECLADLDLGSEELSQGNEEVGEPRPVAFSVTPAKVSHSPFAWRRLLALCLTLFLLCCTDSQQGQHTFGSGSAVAVGASRQLGAMFPNIETPVVDDKLHPLFPGRSLNDETELSARFTPVASVDAIAVSPAADVKLWSRVRNQSSEAEIELARPKPVAK
jgi:general secretion pathway protein A